MFVQELGTGPAILLLHGVPSTPADFVPLANELARDHRVLLPHLPGYPPSAEDRDATFAHQVDLLIAELAQRDISELAGVVGFSSGTYLSFALAQRFPVARIAAIGALAHYAPEVGEVLRGAAAALRADPSGAAIKPILPARWLSPRWRAAHPEDDARVIAWLDHAPARVIADALDAQADAPDLRSSLPSAEIYLRVGALDAACPAAWSQEIAALAPNARLEVVPDAGHALLVEDLPSTMSAIAAHLRR